VVGPPLFDYRPLDGTWKEKNSPNELKVLSFLPLHYQPDVLSLEVLHEIATVVFNNLATLRGLPRLSSAGSQ
jgi:hypothetical protein